ncbi:hypothetical protein CH305_02415 [Rhodococcus sp. 15-649-2-2]|uniref:hypothetical protein n=1 Tax=Rhodococcus sp. 15-649-2-2 TaxID=2023140 RepID=UPI000B9BED6E|nr:hypothetical protein [Rhodococcus sp. 15-649-2-2]OZE87483.1 hypothetical protein CH305_02415 [Rhodococcus sp. 15-649-2-2]
MTNALAFAGGRVTARDIQCFVGIESIANYTAHQHRTALNLITSMTGTVTSSGDLLHDRHGGPLD